MPGIQSNTIATMVAATLIREAREQSGLTLRALAAAAGTSHSTLSAYEHGSKEPSLATLDRVLAAAGARLSLETTQRSATGSRRGDELADVLDLAELFPAEHSERLDYPVFGR